MPLILAGLALGKIGFPAFDLALGFWLIFLFLSLRWRTVIIFGIPGEPLILASETLNAFAPRELQVSEMLKMAVEDNVGDPRPASETFSYTPETFEQGVKTILR